jgi:hypothetical protein
MTSLAAAIAQAADQVRAANHATMRGPLAVGEAYDAVGSLHDLAERLPQLVDFLDRSIQRTDAREHFDDRGTDPGRAILAALGHLDDARFGAIELADHLTFVHNELGHLGRHTPEV